MNDQDFQRMVAMSTGRVPRDQAWLDEQARLGHIQEEAQAKAKYEREHPPARSRREIELEQRQFNLRMFGKSGMERYARPLDDMGELYIPSIDAPGVRVVPQVQGHSGVEPCKGPDGRLLLQNHAGCGIKQKLVLQRS